MRHCLRNAPLSKPIESLILYKCLIISTTIGDFISPRDGYKIFYRTTGGLYWKVFTDFAPAFRRNGIPTSSSRETYFQVKKADWVCPIIAILSSDIYWWWYTITTNLRDLNPSDIQDFPAPVNAIEDPNLTRLGELYLEDLKENSSMLIRGQRQTGRTETQSFKIQLSKPVIEQIDSAMANHYNFSDEELDFIMNYDVKYRMGIDDST